LRTAPAQDIGPPVLERSGAGSAISTRSSPRARARSSVPKPRHMARPTARMGMPTKVMTMPMPSENMVIDNVNMMMLMGSESSR
jgi:hypothetical protein